MVTAMGVEQSEGFRGPELEEAAACLLGVKNAKQLGVQRVIIEGDCLALINKLKTRVKTKNVVGLIVEEIRAITCHFDFFAFSLVRREGCKTQPYEASCKVWFREGPSKILDLAGLDMCNFVDTE